MNQMDGVWCERAFAPWGDMEEQMRREGIALYGLESGDPVTDFDLTGFSLGYELAYTNVLNMLDLAGLPLRSRDRKGLSPLVIAGGTCAFNPEPLAPFVDLFVLGEGEEILPELIDLCRRARMRNGTRLSCLPPPPAAPVSMCPHSMTRLTGRTAPSLPSPPRDGAPQVVTKRIIQDLDKSYFPWTPLFRPPKSSTTRVMLELFRG
jgi:radical SAM superfamily enzyme YgiQ (UPF0313 family)